MNRLFAKLGKVWRASIAKQYRRALLRGVAAATEHEALLASLQFCTIVDVGANRGQFSLVARRSFPKARIFAFEPLPLPAAVFANLFASDPLTRLFIAAIGPAEQLRNMHVAARDDSSSLLEIGPSQVAMFPGTHEVTTTQVRVAPLNAFISASEIERPALLKIDVQGFEYDVILGSKSLLGSFHSIYCECSFAELYIGQKLASEVIGLLAGLGYSLKAVAIRNAIVTDVAHRRTYYLRVQMRSAF